MQNTMFVGGWGELVTGKEVENQSVKKELKRKSCPFLHSEYNMKIVSLKKLVLQQIVPEVLYIFIQ